jgi:hypothetical protein
MRALIWLSLVVLYWVGAFTMACDGDDGDAPGATGTVQATATAAAVASPAERASALCAAADVTAPAGTVRPAEVAEISGIAASRRNAGVLWGHNDSGDTARVIAFSTTGEPRGVYDVAGAEAIDWEDMAIGPGPRDELDYFYLGDIGDNMAQRPEIVVYRAPEPDLPEMPTGAGVIERAERIALRYPDGAHDAETLMVDPLTRDLYIVTKEIIAGDSGVYRASASLLDAGGGAMERVGTIAKAALTPADTPPDDASALVRGVGWLPTGGDISPDGALIAVRTYATVFVWAREDGQSLAEALAGTPCEAPSAVEPQGEAITFDAAADAYFTVSEGAQPPLYRFGE